MAQLNDTMVQGDLRVTGNIYGNISGNAATATSAGKLTTARKTYVTLGTASTTTTRDWSGDTTIPVSGTLAISNGGTGATKVTGSSGALHNLTHDQIGTASQWFLTITNGWERCGYCSVADAKKVLGLGSAAYTASTAYAPSSTVSCTTANVKSALGTGSGTSKYLREDGTWQTPPDTNTWRGIQDNLTSDSTTDSLSAAQGKKLNTNKLDKTTNLAGSGTIAETDIMAVNGSTDGFKMSYSATSSDLGKMKLHTIDDANAILSLGNTVSGSYKEAITIVNGSATITGSLTGNCSGSSGSCTGNAATASAAQAGSALETAINSKSTLALGETSSTAYRGDRGKTAYDHSQATHAPTTSKTAASGGKDLSLVTTGEKYTWNNKSTLALGETSSTAYRGDRGKTAYDHSQATHAPTTSSAAASGGTTLSLVTTGEKYTWNNKSTLALGETSSTAYRGDRGKTAYDHSQATHAPTTSSAAASGGTTLSLVTTGEKYTWNSKAAGNHDHDATYMKTTSGNKSLSFGLATIIGTVNGSHVKLVMPEANEDVYPVSANSTSFSDVLAAYNAHKKLILQIGYTLPGTTLTAIYNIPLNRIVYSDDDTPVIFVWVYTQDSLTGDTNRGVITTWSLGRSSEGTGWASDEKYTYYSETAGLSNKASALIDFGNTSKMTRVGWAGNSIDHVIASGESKSLSESSYLAGYYVADGMGHVKDVKAANVTVGNSIKWNGWKIVVGSTGTDANTLYFV